MAPGAWGPPAPHLGCAPCSAALGDPEDWCWGIRFLPGSLGQRHSQTCSRVLDAPSPTHGTDPSDFLAGTRGDGIEFLRIAGPSRGPASPSAQMEKVAIGPFPAVDWLGTAGSLPPAGSSAAPHSGFPLPDLQEHLPRAGPSGSLPRPWSDLRAPGCFATGALNVGKQTNGEALWQV